jgi:hypothetical protein
LIKNSFKKVNYFQTHQSLIKMFEVKRSWLEEADEKEAK